ncbi:uncharacterized protein [Cherax quadricarinatus]|uniref:uncharacterized protein n=1 Tax=Cherax quadricarinatus TaxID=27406 RepID=UPI00387E40D4
MEINYGSASCSALLLLLLLSIVCGTPPAVPPSPPHAEIMKHLRQLQQEFGETEVAAKWKQGPWSSPASESYEDPSELDEVIPGPLAGLNMESLIRDVPSKDDDDDRSTRKNSYGMYSTVLHPSALFNPKYGDQEE